MEELDYVRFYLLKSVRNKIRPCLLAGAMALSFYATAQAQISVTTYHNDNRRIGWNPSETILTPSNMTPSTFGLRASTPLDDQVDAQPLIVANQMITGQGIHTVVYVVTENNTVYAIDATSGKILKSGHLGSPVPQPLKCNNNGPNVGITSTPTIDVAKQTIYVMAYLLIGGQPVYRLHALNLQTLGDKPGSPIAVSASHSLADGTTYDFNSLVQRQRPALLESGGNVYAAFGSFCDFAFGRSRGWLLGWNASTLAPLAANELTDNLTSAQTKGTNYFLSSIWMSGYGIADDGMGNLFFATGNSDPSLNTYGTNNIEESAVKMPESLSTVLDLFTPSNAFTLDKVDEDFGSGGVLVVPDQPGPMPHLAVAATKDGRLFILDRDAMGGFHNPDIPANVAAGRCWCGPSYYQGADGIGRVVTSGGTIIKGVGSQSNLKTWTINTALTPALTLEASFTFPTTRQDPGFFTAVSSNGTTAQTAVIWTVARPTGPDHHLTLYAFNAKQSGGTLPLLWSGAAGFWPNLGGNANVVPVVANGMVYVASYRALSIFGLTSHRAQTKVQLIPPPPVPESMPAAALFWGTVRSVHGSRVVLVLRTGELLQVDVSEAWKAGTTVVPVVGKNVSVNGRLDENGLLHADIMWRAKEQASWGADKRD